MLQNELGETIKMSAKMILPLVGGVGIGAVLGYVAGGGNYDAIRPRIDAVPAQPKANTAFTYTFSNFPPNTQLVSARNSTVVNGDLVNIGVTDSTGKLVAPSTAPQATGAWYIYAFDAPTGKYCAVYTLIVVP